MKKFKFFDAHCHAYELKNLSVLKDFLLVSVAEDLETSKKNLQLKNRENIIVGIGIHPWVVERINEDDLKELEKLVKENEIKMIGEIGLDKAVAWRSYSLQPEVFEFQLNLAKEFDLPVNLHGAGAWKEVFDLVLKKDIKFANFHWYSGSLDLLKEIQSVGYFISANLSLIVKENHKRCVEFVDVKNLLVESDGPYEYKGLKLTPEKIPETIVEIAKLKGINEKELEKILWENLESFIPKI